MIRLYSDTSANLPIHYIKEYSIKIVPFSYTVNGEVVPYSEETDFDGAAFYSAMSKGADVRTSMINIEAFLEAFRTALDSGDDVLYVGMSGGISGAANAAANAARELREEYHDRKIITIDTFGASLGEGFLVLAAARMIKTGASIDEVEGYILKIRDKMCQYFTVDDLSYLKKGGRISGAAALIGTALKIKPILTGDECGRIVAIDKVRGRCQALTYLSEKYDLLCADKSAEIGIAHADSEDGVDFLLQKLREKGFTGNCITVLYEPVTGSHVGPGTVALFFMGTHK